MARPGIGSWVGRKKGNCLQKVKNKAIGRSAGGYKVERPGNIAGQKRRKLIACEKLKIGQLAGRRAHTEQYPREKTINSVFAIGSGQAIRPGKKKSK